MRLAVVLVDDDPAGTRLCGRPAVDWLLEAVTKLGPGALAVTPGRVTQRVAEHALLAGLPAQLTGPDVLTLVLRCAVPLLPPAVLRRAVEAAGSAGAARAVLVESVPQAPWWTATPGPAEVLALALVGAPGSLGWPATPVLAAPAGRPVEVVPVDGPAALCVTRPAERVAAQNALYRRIADQWLARGVTVDDPGSVRIDATVQIGHGAHIHAGTELLGRTVIGPGSEIGPATTVRESRIGAGCLVQYAVCQHSEIGDGANIGPYCWIRSGSRLGAGTRAGSFVEIADSVVGAGTSIPHLGGLIAADVGEGCNIAGLSGPANFDGERKHRLRVGDHVSIGAGNILVAPLSIGDGAHTAAGSVITKDVPSGALAAARVEQRNFPGWTVANLPDSAGAAAARSAAGGG